MKQSDLFLQSEGDAWHERNKDKPRLPDPVIEAMQACQLQPKSVLELGCGDGWRLAEIKKIWNPSLVRGCDASKEATDNAMVSDIRQDDILGYIKHIGDKRYDTIIFGFCLYLVDREDLMMIAAHTDRVLQDKGHIIIHDFLSEPHKRSYHHKEGVWSYKQNYAMLWGGNPAYSKAQTSALDAQGAAVIILQKDITAGWPERAI